MKEITTNYFECYIPGLVIRNPPYNMDWGSEIMVKITGAEESYLTEKVTIVTKPDKVTNLREIAYMRTRNSITLIWDEPQFNGGSSMTATVMIQRQNN